VLAVWCSMSLMPSLFKTRSHRFVVAL